MRRGVVGDLGCNHGVDRPGHGDDRGLRSWLLILIDAWIERKRSPSRPAASSATHRESSIDCAWTRHSEVSFSSNSSVINSTLSMGEVRGELRIAATIEPLDAPIYHGRTDSQSLAKEIQGSQTNVGAPPPPPMASAAADISRRKAGSARGFVDDQFELEQRHNSRGTPMASVTPTGRPPTRDDPPLQ